MKENSEVSGDNPGMRKHALAVMETVNVAVERVRNSALGELAEDLFDVGVAHHTLQVKVTEQHFAVSVHARRSTQRFTLSHTPCTHSLTVLEVNVCPVLERELCSQC